MGAKFLDWVDFFAAVLVLIRITSFLAVSLFFSSMAIPAYAKIGLGVVMTLLIFPTVDHAGLGNLIENEWQFMLLALKECLVGIIIGFTAALVFSAITVAGELVDLHMGFSMAGIFDPQTGSNVTLMGRFMYTLGILLFLAVDGHHSLLLALSRSFEILPLGAAVLSRRISVDMLIFFKEMFLLGFKIAAPLIAVMLISDLCLSLISRTVPQINVFIMGFPLKAGLGIIVLIIILPLFTAVITGLVGQIERDLLQIMRGMGQ